MQQLEELTSIIERLAQAESFRTAADLLTHWAREYTGCQASVLRLIVDGEEQDWLGGCSAHGASESWARDETVIAASECLCGRVTSGSVDVGLPFFTSGGSFVWGRMGGLTSEFSSADLGELRGRCISERYESVAIFPIRGDRRIIGSLHLADPRPEWFEEKAEVVQAACRLAGDILLRDRESERERAVLDRIQSALLPALPPRLDGLSIGVSFGSATEMARLGGDFYDVIDLDESGVLVLVGDVCGKGVEAAGMAARARYTLEARAGKSGDPSRFMQAANSALLRQLPDNRFVTAVACLIEPRNGLVKVCLAGHPSPLHLDGTGSAEISAPHNPPLGVFPGIRFAGSDQQFSPGDVLVVYTDGVTDSRRGSQEFGVGGILTAAKSISDHDPSEIARRVCAAAADFHDTAIPADDRLVMAVRLN